MSSIKNLLKAAPKMRNSLPEKINATPVPNGPLIKKKGPFKGSTLKNGGSPSYDRELASLKGRIKFTKKKEGGKVKVKAGGENHVVYKATKNAGKAKKGDIMVNHPTMDKGKWDTINLTKIGRAKTVKQGVASTKKWHKDNPDYKYKGKGNGKDSSMDKKRR
jgi:hypothetical protein